MRQATAKRAHETSPITPNAQREDFGASQPYGNAATAAQLASETTTEQSPVLSSAAADLEAAHELAANPSWAKETAEAEPYEEPSPIEASRKPTGPASKEEALLNRRYDLKAADELLERGRRLSPNDPEHKLFKNTIEWIDAGLCKLVVLSPTHDSHRRKLAPGEVAYFDTRVTHPDEGADYNTGSDEGITAQSKSTYGRFERETNTMYLYSPGNRDLAALEDTLVHEIQHDADSSGKGERWSEPPEHDLEARDKTPDELWNLYQSEFRAYSIERKPPETSRTQFDVTAVDIGKDRRRGTSDDFRETVRTNFVNEHQAAIFSHLWHRVEDAVYWDNRWTVYSGYIPHYYVFDPNFRKMVDTFDTAVGGNLINSPRIELLAQAIEHVHWKPIEAAVNALDLADKQFLNDKARSEPFWRWATEVNAEMTQKIEKTISISAL